MHNEWEVGIRNAVSGDVIWCRVISFQVAMTNQGPVPLTLYESDDGEIAIALGGPKIRIQVSINALG